ncbi:hypothetical protein J2753_000710 [Halolamina salifodinae]|uniref:Uncharacterized protein n=1 Tax=Halolamina salifodinae TaxID=1202767 RepID=A0A8T4GT99_9EURY|nr:hypothetical protein [Halolamina salifodinae]
MTSCDRTALHRGHSLPNRLTPVRSFVLRGSKWFERAKLSRHVAENRRFSAASQKALPSGDAKRRGAPLVSLPRGPTRFVAGGVAAGCHRKPLAFGCPRGFAPPRQRNLRFRPARGTLARSFAPTRCAGDPCVARTASESFALALLTLRATAGCGGGGRLALASARRARGEEWGIGTVPLTGAKLPFASRKAAPSCDVDENLRFSSANQKSEISGDRASCPALCGHNLPTSEMLLLLR